MNLREIRALARAGATDAAWSLIDAAPAGTEALTLRGRLLKDRAASEQGSARTALLRDAADAYAQAAAARPATYPLINAATLSLLGGARARAAQLATETLALLESGQHEPDTRYWLAATRAEALLLLDREVEARAALRDAIAGTPRAWEDHAVTIRQFRLILAELDRPTAWLDACRPPAPIHFAGPIGLRGDDAQFGGELAAAISANGAGIAVGALAAGFDILAAEALAGAGADLHIVLPAPPDLFVARSVAPAGAAWCARFDALLAAAAQVDILDLPAGLSAAAVALAEEMAIGCAVRSAQLLDRETLLLRLAGTESERDPAARPNLRRIDLRGGVVGGGGCDLGPPDHVAALLGTGHADADRLAALTGATPQPLSTGCYVTLADPVAAAHAALALCEAKDAAIVLDQRPPCPDGAPDTAALAALLALPPRRYPIATRSAALVLAARGAPFRLALAGASGALPDSDDFFSLWATPRSPDPTTAAAS
jgi:hypothetical protein